MIRLTQWRRLMQIYAIFSKHGLDRLIKPFSFLTPLRLLIMCNPRTWLRYKQPSSGIALRQALEELGPIFVKFGQALSTRPDLLPSDLSMELSKLQDQVPPCALEYILVTVETSLGRKIKDLFATFDEQPLASASIAQVHAATLHDGKKVVVKVLRPNIRSIIEKDLKILYTIAYLVEKYWHDGKRLKPQQVIQEFEQSLFREIDFQQEAANAAQLRRNFQNSPLLYVPEVYWNYVSEEVLVMERIYGIPVTDLDNLFTHNINLKKLSERGLEIFFLQVFRDSFFHADMHPGNIFVSMQNPEDPQYICVDFGIMGTLSDKDQRYLAENLLAFFNRDYRRVAELHIESGWVARTTRADEFQSAIRTVCEPIFEKPLKDLSFAQLIMRLFQVARKFNMEVQPQLVLLQKTLLAVEGLGRQINPDLDLWTTAKPFFEKFVQEQIGPKAFVRNLKHNIPFFMEHLPSMPRLLNDVLLLNKEHLRGTLKNNSPQDTPKNNQLGLGIGVGICLVMFGVSIVSYYVPFKPLEFTLVSAVIGVFGGLLAIVFRRI
jgi:ubiquinone biosynthesis protein